MEEIEDLLDEIHLGDCISIMKDMPSGKIDLIFADPPYNIGIKYLSLIHISEPTRPY